MRVLVAGAEGFIGRFIVVALRAAGHTVVAGVRHPSDPNSIRCEFARDLKAADWVPRLAGIDAIVNAVGILRESGTNSFDSVHVTGPKTLFEAAHMAGVRRVIQISALGSAHAGEYLSTKHRGDAELAKWDLDWTIIRPSLVYSLRGSYGGTSLLRAMAALPGIIAVPGMGNYRMQPILAEDLSAVVVCLLERQAGFREIVSAVGPAPVTLLEYLVALRQWLGLPAARVLHVPLLLAEFGSRLGEHLSYRPVGMTMWRMLTLENTAPPDCFRELVALSGVTPRSMQQAYDSTPSCVQDRWHARLYFLGMKLRLALAVLWIASGVVGLFTPMTETRALLAGTGLPASLAAPMFTVGSVVDLILGVLVLLAWRPMVVASLMIVSLLVYTLFIGIAMPSVWLEPFGGLLKNIPLIPAVWVMGVLSSRR